MRSKEDNFQVLCLCAILVRQKASGVQEQEKYLEQWNSLFRLVLFVELKLLWNRSRTRTIISSTRVIGRAKRAPHWGVQSRFRVIYVGMYVCRGPKSVGGNTWAKRAHAQSQYWAVKSDQ